MEKTSKTRRFVGGNESFARDVLCDLMGNEVAATVAVLSMLFWES